MKNEALSSAQQSQWAAIVIGSGIGGLSTAAYGLECNVRQFGPFRPRSRTKIRGGRVFGDPSRLTVGGADWGPLKASTNLGRPSSRKHRGDLPEQADQEPPMTTMSVSRGSHA